MTSQSRPDTASLPAGVGLSIGCAEVRAGQDVMDLVKVADERMYENKREAGRYASIAD